jgi:hypothetical protein
MFHYNNPDDLRNTLCFKLTEQIITKGKSTKEILHFLCFCCSLSVSERANLTYQAVNQNQTGKVD